eukprot:s235_g22.t1
MQQLLPYPQDQSLVSLAHDAGKTKEEASDEITPTEPDESDVEDLEAEPEAHGEGEEYMEGGEEEERVPDPELEAEEVVGEAKITSDNPDQMDTLPLEVDSYWRIDPTMGTTTPPKDGEEEEGGSDVCLEGPASSEGEVLKGEKGEIKPETEKKKKKKNSTAKDEAKGEIKSEKVKKDVMSEPAQKRRRLRKCEETNEKPDPEARPAKNEEADVGGRDEEVDVPLVQDLVSDDEKKDAESRAAFKDSYKGIWTLWAQRKMKKAAREEEDEAEDLDKFIRQQDEASEEAKAQKGRGRGRGKGKGRGRSAAAKSKTQKTDNKGKELEVPETAQEHAPEIEVSQAEKADRPGKVPRKSPKETQKKTGEPDGQSEKEKEKETQKKTGVPDGQSEKEKDKETQKKTGVPDGQSEKEKEATGKNRSGDVSQKRRPRGVLSPSQARMKIIKRMGAAKDESELSTSPDAARKEFEDLLRTEPKFKKLLDFITMEQKWGVRVQDPLKLN